MAFGSLLLVLNALVLGFRHGLDWDHFAAIMDIVGTSKLKRRGLVLSTVYACGHASVVLLLGAAALSFSAILPAWVDAVMERVVGITLLILGSWVFYSVIQFVQGSNEFEPKSRWMVIFAMARHLGNRLRGVFTGQARQEEIRVDQYGVRTAFGIGILHAIGAETGTQVLLIAAIGGASSHGLGLVILLAFVAGLLTSNSIVAIVGSLGFIRAARLKHAYIVAGISAGLFSLIVGSFFAFGQSDRLPSLYADNAANHPF